MKLFVIENTLNNHCYVVRAETSSHALELAGEEGKNWVTSWLLDTDGEPGVLWDHEPEPNSR